MNVILPAGAWFALLIVATAALSFLRSARVTGWRGERRVANILRRVAHKQSGVLVTNVIVPRAEGSTEIDAILISRMGIFVFEVKTLKGTISGGAQRKRWRQQIGRRGFDFQNPIHQNHLHLKTLQGLLGIERNLLTPIVVFAGRCKISKKIRALVVPANELGKYVLTLHHQAAEAKLPDPASVGQIVEKISALRLPPGRATRRAHRDYLKNKNAG